MSYPILLLLSGALAVLPSAPRPADGVDDLEFEELVAAVAARALEDDVVSGLSIAVAVGPELLVSEGWGYADANRGQPAGAASRYRAGAVTPQLVAAALVRLAQGGALDLDDPVHEHLGGLPYGELEGGPITLRHLLTHTSGIPDCGALVESMEQRGAEPSGEALLAAIGALTLEFDAGDCFAYSASNDFLLGLVLEAVTELEVAEHLRQAVFEPLELEDTLYCYESAPLRERAAAVREVAGELVEDDSGFQPFRADALCSSAPDLVRWLRALVQEDWAGEEGRAVLFGEARLADGSPTSYGCGFGLTPLEDYEGVSFGGGSGGSRVHVAYYPAPDLTIAVLASGEDAPVARLERRIAREFFELPLPGIQDLPLTPERRARYGGDYYVGCSRYQIAERGERLHLLPPEGDGHVLLYQGRDVFLAEDDPETRLTFELGERGPARSFLLEEQGAQTVARRMD